MRVHWRVHALVVMDIRWDVHVSVPQNYIYMLEKHPKLYMPLYTYARITLYTNIRRSYRLLYCARTVYVLEQYLQLYMQSYH